MKPSTHSSSFSLLTTLLLLTSAVHPYVLHCDGDIPPSGDPRVLAFNSLTALCSTHPTGFGYVCDYNGELRVQLDFANLWVGPHATTSLYMLCERQCHCADVDPDTPELPAAQHPAQQIAAPVIDIQQLIDEPERAHRCSEWYGRPSEHDCYNIMTIMDQDLRNQGVNVNGLTHFVGEEVENAPAGSTTLPKLWSFESCNVLFYFEDAAESAIERWEKSQAAFVDIIYGCVRNEQMGGLTASAPGSPINVLVFGTDSNYKRMRDENLVSEIDTTGNALCNILDTGGSDESVNGMSHTSTGQSRVGNNCYRASDCAGFQDSICAYNGDVDLPIDSSWGKFTCQTIPRVGYSVAAAKTWGNCFSGRCLLEANGNLFISQAASNSTSQTVNGSSPTLDRYLEMHPDSQIWQAVNASLDAPGKQNASSTIPPPPTLSDVPELTDPRLCACNCTYVARSCCLQPIVFPDVTPTKGNSSFHQILKGPQGTCCNKDTGTFDNTTADANTVDKEGACVPSY